MKQNEVIRHYRIMRGKTQKDIANRLGITHSGYSKYERGERKISIDLWIELSMILDFPFGLLHEESDEAAQNNSAIHFTVPLDKIAYDIKANINKMTTDEINSAKLLFKETYDRLEREKLLWIKYLQPKDFETVIKEFGIEKLYINPTLKNH